MRLVSKSFFVLMFAYFYDPVKCFIKVIFFYYFFQIMFYLSRDFCLSFLCHNAKSNSRPVKEKKILFTLRSFFLFSVFGPEKSFGTAGNQ